MESHRPHASPHVENFPDKHLSAMIGKASTNGKKDRLEHLSTNDATHHQRLKEMQENP
jgi:hypothetical protein